MNDPMSLWPDYVEDSHGTVIAHAMARTPGAFLQCRGRIAKAGESSFASAVGTCLAALHAAMALAYAPAVSPHPEQVARIGMAFAAVQEYLGVLQETLAEAGGVSIATISRDQRRLTDRVSSRVLDRIARRFGVPVGLLTHPPATRREMMEALGLSLGERRADEPGPS